MSSSTNLSRLWQLGAWLVLALISPGRSFGQTAYGSITGRVTDSRGHAIDTGYVEVKDTNQANGPNQAVVWSGYTDDNGQFTADNLAPGRYEITCVGGEFLPRSQTTPLMAGQTLRLRFRLKNRRVVPGFSRLDEGPGKMQLPRGYVAGNLEGLYCIDTVCGEIWDSHRVSIISYDIGALAGSWFDNHHESAQAYTYFWYGKATINNQPAQYAVFGAERPTEMRLSFPASYANFDASVSNEEEIRTALRVLLTYQGKGYSHSPKSVIDVRFVTHEGQPLSGVAVALQAAAPQDTRIQQTDEIGHARFADVLPGRYDLKIAAGRSCASANQHWKISLGSAEILLRSFTIRCR